MNEDIRDYNKEQKLEDAKNIYGETKMCSPFLWKVRRWLSLVSFQEFYEDISSQVIGQPNLKKFLANVYNYLKCLASNMPTNNNVILAAPSGSGKTETYRALKRYFNEYIPGFPINILDLSQVTSAGFKGNEPSEIVNPFIMGKSAFGICFLDEFDKKLEPSYTSRNVDANREVQNNLLTIIEGSNVATKNGLVDTSDIMFVGLGSFDKFREKREAKVSVIGFGASNDEEVVNHFAPITKENMLEHGGTNELIGRFPFVINYDILSEEAINKIIEKAARSVEENYECQIVISDEFKYELHKTAMSKFGCRQIDSTIRNLALDEYTTSLCEAGGEMLVINLENETCASHHWRDFTDEELGLVSCDNEYEDGALVKL